MPAKQNIYKDLSGDRKAKLQDFVFNPKAEDPTGAERTPQELYTNTADNQLKYFDDNLDLRYAVPGVVKEIPPTELDINYGLGTEWKLKDGSAVFKLLNIDEFGKAQWRELPELEPLILLDKNIILYCDSNTGDDSNEGTDAEPFETIPGAIAKINSTYDFNNGKYRYVLRVRGEHILDSFVFNAPTGATSQNFYLDGYSPDAKISSTSNYVISLKTNIQLFVRDLEFTSTSLNNCFLVSDGRLIVSGCKFSGNIDNIFNLSAFGRLRTLDNTIENLTAQSLIKCTHRSDYFQTGDFKAIGTNSIDTVLYIANSTIAYITPTATFTLEDGATVAGSPFIKFGNSSLRLGDIDQLSAWGDTPGEWYGAGLYRSRSINFNYSHWVEGLEISLNGGALAVTAGEAMILRSVVDKSSRFWKVCILADQELPFPSILTTNNEAYAYVNKDAEIEFLTVPPDPDNLLDRVCLGKITTLGNSIINSVDAQITERSPEFLDGLNSPGSIPNCTISNAAMTNLNNTLAGTPWVFDPLTFSTSSPIYTATADGITTSASGTYRVDAILNCSVPTDGAQRPSVGIRIAINGVERTVAGRSAYIRRISGHYRASATVFARLSLNPGDEIKIIGFRDAAGGVVDCPAGESELTIMKLT